MSGEHFLSKSVLCQVDESGANAVQLGGVPWIAPGQTRPIPINALTSNILCTRHNSALAPLDQEAGRFFRAIKEIFDDIHDTKTLSRKSKFFLFSGEEIELWLLKTALGLFYSGNAGKDGKKLNKTHILHPSCSFSLYDAAINPPCGVYVVHDEAELDGWQGTLQIASLSDDENQRFVGIRFVYASLILTLLFDPATTLGEQFTRTQTFRPSHLIFKNSKRDHTIMLTWPAKVGQPDRAVLAEFNGRRTRRSYIDPKIVARIMAFVDQRVPKGYVSVWLTGSRARGQQRDDSDWDVIVFHQDAPSRREELFLSNVVEAVDGVGTIELVIAHPDHWEDERPYMVELRARGVRLR